MQTHPFENQNGRVHIRQAVGAPVSPDEATRLEALHACDILDTVPEVAFERLTNLAVRLFHVPIALVSFVDADRQWFKSCFGLDLRQTDRKLSFCAHTILTDDVMVVPDATKDARFVDNALVTGTPHIRFYAGAPLKTASGQNIGSLCIIDTVPRQFTVDEQALLADLAAIAAGELEIRYTARELREREAILQQALRENNHLSVAVASLMCGVVVTDAKRAGNPVIFANAGFMAMSGYTEREILGRSCRFLEGPDTDPATVARLRETHR